MTKGVRLLHLAFWVHVAGCTPMKPEARAPLPSTHSASSAARVVETVLSQSPTQERVPIAAHEAGSPIAIYSNTMQVEGLALRGDRLWVATRGGVEEYERKDLTRLRVYTTLDGLPSLFVTSISVAATGTVLVTTSGHQCEKPGSSVRFSCAARSVDARQAASAAQAGALIGERVEGSPVTVRIVESDGTEWLGTAGLGVFQRTSGHLVALTPNNQIAGNHVVAIAEWKQATYFATFDRGLSRFAAGRFTQAPLGPRMLNDLAQTNRGLYVATADGLYVTYDGERYQRDERVTERAVTDLAFDAKKQVLYAAATNSLWELPVGRPKATPQVVYEPGGSRALQAVDVSPDGTVFLASEDRGVMRRDARKQFTRFDRLAGYPSSWAIDVLGLDHKSALVGSLRHGVFALTNASPFPNDLDPWVLFLGRDSQKPATLFVGTQGGAMQLSESGPRSFARLPNPCVHTVAHLSTGLWVGTEGGLALYE